MLEDVTKMGDQGSFKEGLLVYITKKYFFANHFRPPRDPGMPSMSPETSHIAQIPVFDDRPISKEILQKNRKCFFFEIKNINQQSFFNPLRTRLVLALRATREDAPLRARVA